MKLKTEAPSPCAEVSSGAKGGKLFGGTIINRGGSLSFSDCMFNDSTSWLSGGFAQLESGRTEVSGSRIAHAHSGTLGGCFYLVGGELHVVKTVVEEYEPCHNVKTARKSSFRKRGTCARRRMITWKSDYTVVRYPWTLKTRLRLLKAQKARMIDEMIQRYMHMHVKTFHVIAVDPD